MWSEANCCHQVFRTRTVNNRNWTDNPLSAKFWEFNAYHATSAVSMRYALKEGTRDFNFPLFLFTDKNLQDDYPLPWNWVGDARKHVITSFLARRAGEGRTKEEKTGNVYSFIFPIYQRNNKDNSIEHWRSIHGHWILNQCILCLNCFLGNTIIYWKKTSVIESFLTLTSDLLNRYLIIHVIWQCGTEIRHRNLCFQINFRWLP